MINQLHQTFRVPEELHQQRLDLSLSQLIPDYSRSQIQHWIKQGFVTVNGQVITKTKHPVLLEEEISVQATLLIQNHWAAQDIPLDIVFEDDFLMVVNKPVGLIVHPGAGNQDKTLVNALLHHCPALELIPRAGLIHRLDKNTSGLLVIAKDLSTHHYLVEALQAREISREYCAIVNGVMISGGTVDEPMGRHATHRTKMCVQKSGREAVTHYRVLEKFQAHTFIRVMLETGRTHQIRVHMAHIHYPLVGDRLYGKKHDFLKKLTPSLIDTLQAFQHQALHATKLSFIHPHTEEEKTFQVDPPLDMQTLLTELRLDMKQK